jgi:hypothetical protein
MMFRSSSVVGARMTEWMKVGVGCVIGRSHKYLKNRGEGPLKFVSGPESARDLGAL